jgi:hypothetical protein
MLNKAPETLMVSWIWITCANKGLQWEKQHKHGQTQAEKKRVDKRRIPKPGILYAVSAKHNSHQQSLVKALLKYDEGQRPYFNGHILRVYPLT